MHKSLFIRKTVASVMLIVFAIGITPTIVFHNLFANHIDTVNKTGKNNREQISAPMFNCHCNNIVAESPFTEPPQIIIALSETVYNAFVIANAVTYISSPPCFKTLRGPPAV